MSDKIGDGGPAFPTAHNGEAYSGVSARDYFASAAIHALLGGFYQSDMYGSDGDDRRRCAAMHAYKMADEMLKARSTK